MKHIDPIYKEYVESLDHNWFDCQVALHSIIEKLNERSENDIEYSIIKKLFIFQEDKTRYLNDIELLKEKYSKLFERYQEEQKEEERVYKEVCEKVNKDSNKTTEEKYDLIIEALRQYNESEIDKKSTESLWLDDHKEEISLKDEWIDKHSFDAPRPDFSGFNSEDKIRKNIRNALSKYTDLLYDFELFYLFGFDETEENVDPEEGIMKDSWRTEAKYEMLKYFNDLCKFRDRVIRKKIMPSA